VEAAIGAEMAGAAGAGGEGDSEAKGKKGET
jgi:hypothetical protein